MTSNFHTDKPCGCGTCEDAIKAALRYRNSIADNDCPIYNLRVAAALYTMAAVIFKNWAIEGITGHNVAEDAGTEVSAIDSFHVMAVAAEADEAYREISDHVLSLLQSYNMIKNIYAASKGQYVAEEVKTH